MAFSALTVTISHLLHPVPDIWIFMIYLDLSLRTCVTQVKMLQTHGVSSL